MSNKLSFTAISKYLSCPEEYRLYYKEKLSPTGLNSALYFGKAIDVALETLLKTKSLTEATKHFETVFIRDPNVQYVDFDVDEELITQEEFEEDKAFYSLKKKGLVMIEGFYKDILPKIKKIYSTQDVLLIQNAEGDRIKAVTDLIVEWENGDIVLFDIKTSALPYDDNAAEQSVQLATYYHAFKQKHPNINKIGFIVLRKQLKKNRVKICSVCGFDGSSGRHSTCPNKRNNGRCEGEWTTTIRPEPYIQIIISEPNTRLETMVIDNIGKINHSIKSDNFYQNLNNCKRGKDRLCDYYNLCHKGSTKGLIKR